jgi:hypothetical protein
MPEHREIDSRLAQPLPAASEDPSETGLPPEYAGRPEPARTSPVNGCCHCVVTLITPAAALQERHK